LLLLVVMVLLLLLLLLPPRKAEAVRRERKGRKRNLALLSFGEQAEEEEADLQLQGASTKIK
jgi:hypothetical protein